MIGEQIQQQFEQELTVLLAKYNAELNVENFANKTWFGIDNMVVDFNYNEEYQTCTPQLVLGRRFQSNPPLPDVGITNMEKEFIICAAVWYNDGLKHEGQPKNIEVGFVIAGRRHHNCYATASALAGKDEAIRMKIVNIENRMTREDYRKSQGFITSLDRYVDRGEAYQIAKQNNQIQYGKDAIGNETPILISENLY